MHEYLVPKQLKSGLRNTGVMGGISMMVMKSILSSKSAANRAQNHPITDVPAFFVHPCNTAEAMQDIIGGRSISVEAYLQIWLGLVGGCVGLALPKGLAIGFDIVRT